MGLSEAMRRRLLQRQDECLRRMQAQIQCDIVLYHGVSS
jgi:hypothetical protein